MRVGGREECCAWDSDRRTVCCAAVPESEVITHQAFTSRPAFETSRAQQQSHACVPLGRETLGAHQASARDGATRVGWDFGMAQSPSRIQQWMDAATQTLKPAWTQRSSH